MAMRVTGGLPSANVRAQAGGPGVRAFSPDRQLARVRESAGGRYVDMALLYVNCAGSLFG